MLNDQELEQAKAAYARWAEINPHAGDPLLAFLAGWQLCDQPVEYEGTSRVPGDRLTRLADIAVDAITAHREGMARPKLILMLQDEGDGGIMMKGYRDTLAALGDLMRHTNQLLKAHNIDLAELFSGVDLNKLMETEAPAAFRRNGTSSLRHPDTAMPAIDRHIKRIIKARRESTA